MIDLFPHNLTAYESAIEMLDETGKAAIIHPTGTGKSFIAFKLCENNEDKRILWLSPSEYIFKTQIENLKAVSEGYCSNNIVFYTYAKLIYMSVDEIGEIKPDYIILDEFHRCGAEVWGKGVQNVLTAYPNIPVLGLSATNIRYLDNQRDMADELFDGNVASSMTLGEAIVRGILNPPKYVLSVFQYQKDLDKSFRVVDEVCDCIELFEKFNDTLVASWYYMFDETKKYYEQHGNLKVPTKFKTEQQGYSLGHWLTTQRKVRRGEQFGILGEDRITKLDSIGMVWDSYKDLSWKKNYAAAKRYYAENGDLRIPIPYTTEAGIKLGNWIANQRNNKGGTDRYRQLSPEQIERLDSIGMVWNVAEYAWAREYEQA